MGASFDQFHRTAASEEGTVYPVVETVGAALASPPGGGGVLAPVVDLGNFFSQTNERINRVRQAAADYVACGWALCAIAIGSKGPKTKDWQHKPLAQGVIGNHGLGLIHALSGTCALDLDDLQAAEAWLGVRGIELRDLLAADDAVQVVSGRPNRAKLLYRLPEGVQPPITKQIKQAGAMILEFRCAGGSGTGCQDVLPPTIHPDTGAEYQWGGAGEFTNLPVLPHALFDVWNTAMASSTNVGGSTRNPSNVIVEGGRNLALFKRAGDLISAGMAQESVLAALLKENEIKSP
jgi:hypothetical protein